MNEMGDKRYFLFVATVFVFVFAMFLTANAEELHVIYPISPIDTQIGPPPFSHPNYDIQAYILFPNETKKWILDQNAMSGVCRFVCDDTVEIELRTLNYDFIMDTEVQSGKVGYRNFAGNLRSLSY